MDKEHNLLLKSMLRIIYAEDTLRMLDYVKKKGILSFYCFALTNII